MREYDDSELGAPEVEEREGEGEDDRLLDMAVRDFELNFTEKVKLLVFHCRYALYAIELQSSVL